MMTGGLILRGLANITFAHERPGYGMTVQAVVDMTRLAHSQLEEQERLMRRRRRNPLYYAHLLPSFARRSRTLERDLRWSERRIRKSTQA